MNGTVSEFNLSIRRPRPSSLLPPPFSLLPDRLSSLFSELQEHLFLWPRVKDPRSTTPRGYLVLLSASIEYSITGKYRGPSSKLPTMLHGLV